MTTPMLMGAVPLPSADASSRTYRCERCGAVHSAVWSDLGAQRQREGRWMPKGFPPGMWVAPKVAHRSTDDEVVGHCASCDPGPEAEERRRARELAARLAAAGVPEQYRQFSLEADAMIRQRDGEPIAEFQARARNLQKFGATNENLAALQSLRAWTRSNGGKVPRQWVILSGPPGTGKTACLGAIARKLLDVRPLAKVEIPDERLSFRPKTQEAWDYAVSAGLTQAWCRRPIPEVKYLNAAELVSADEMRFRNDAFHGDPKGHYVKWRGILLLDELALVPASGDRALRESEARLFSQLLMPRFDANRLTIIATNREFHELTTKGRNLFGDALADRLARAVHVRLGGPSWR